MSDQWELLEHGSIGDILRSRARYERFLRYHSKYYAELAQQRAQVYDSLKASLAERAGSFQFSRWQRAVKYKYSLSPLSAKGSLTEPGGRFNVGGIDPTRLPVFAGLYLAADKGTALAKLLGQRDNQGQQLTAEEQALTKTASVTVVSVSGELESALDARNEENLTGFVGLIKGFRLSNGLIREAKALGTAPPRLVTTARELKGELESPNWRGWAWLCDVPASSQIFGQIVMNAGIEGIIYISTLTHKACLVVYPQNFANSSSFIELDDPAPSDSVQKRIDHSTFTHFV